LAGGNDIKVRVENWSAMLLRVQVRCVDKERDVRCTLHDNRIFADPPANLRGELLN
jgi:hypothetical protein